jgi:hypothetical protein
LAGPPGLTRLHELRLGAKVEYPGYPQSTPKNQSRMGYGPYCTKVVTTKNGRTVACYRRNQLEILQLFFMWYVST